MESDGQKKKKNKYTGEPDSDAGMRMGYHSEKGSTDNQGGDGMRMGYHSEKENPGKHSKRLQHK